MIVVFSFYLKMLSIWICVSSQMLYLCSAGGAATGEKGSVKGGDGGIKVMESTER